MSIFGPEDRHEDGHAPPPGGVTLWASSPLPWPSLVRGAPAAIAANPVVIASRSTGPYTRRARPRRGSATDVVGNHVHPGDSVGSCGNSGNSTHSTCTSRPQTAPTGTRRPGPHHFRSPQRPCDAPRAESSPPEHPFVPTWMRLCHRRRRPSRRTAHRPRRRPARPRPPSAADAPADVVWGCAGVHDTP